MRERRLMLRCGRVHEVVVDKSGNPAARLFGGWNAGGGGLVLWIMGEHAPILCPYALQGVINPRHLVLIRVRTALDGLWAAEEGLRCGAVRTVVIEADSPIDLRKSRRLQLAAEAGGTLGLFLGPDSGNTAAETRWSCASLPTTDGNAIRFSWKQLKNKKGPTRCWEAVRDGATGDLRVAAASGGGAGVEGDAGSGSPPGHRERGERRLEALLAEHGGA